MPAPRPCIERVGGRGSAGCPRYAVPGKSRCEEHQREHEKRRRQEGGSPGTTPAWARARKKALEREGYRCQNCGRTEDQARAAGTWLEVHHVDAAGVRAPTHDLSKLEVLCRTPCHTATLAATAKARRKPWPPVRG
jgi:5-methylcytosine-specific restriction endonuclease McrA